MTLILFQITFRSHFIFIQWLRNHLLPCPFKLLTGIDCPGCGFQRAVMALLEGDLQKSIQLYPPAIPVILAFMYLLADNYLQVDNKSGVVKKTVFIVVSLIITISYSIKMWHLFQRYNMAV